MHDVLFFSFCFFILYNVKTRLLDITLFFHFSPLSNTIDILLLSTFRGLLVFTMHGQCFMVLESFTLHGNKYILQVHYAPSYHPPLLFGDSKMRRENSIPCNNGPERKQDQAFESCFIKRRGRVKEALESLAWPGLFMYNEVSQMSWWRSCIVSIRLPKIFSNIEFYPECTKNCSWRIKCGFRIQFMHSSEALSIRI